MDPRAELRRVLKSYVNQITVMVREINAQPISAKAKADAIKKLSGMSTKERMDILNKHFGGGPTLAKSLTGFVSEGRPRGVPGFKGTKKN